MSRRSRYAYSFQFIYLCAALLRLAVHECQSLCSVHFNISRKNRSIEMQKKKQKMGERIQEEEKSRQGGGGNLFPLSIKPFCLSFFFLSFTPRISLSYLFFLFHLLHQFRQLKQPTTDMGFMTKISLSLGITLNHSVSDSHT